MMRKVLYLLVLVVGWVAGLFSFTFLYGPAIEEETERMIVFYQLAALNEIRAESISLHSSSENGEFISSLLSAICMKITSLKSEANTLGGKKTDPVNVRDYAELVHGRYEKLLDSLKLSSTICNNHRKTGSERN
jgi:hypothetical protein